MATEGFRRRNIHQEQPTCWGEHNLVTDGQRKFGIASYEEHDYGEPLYLYSREIPKEKIKYWAEIPHSPYTTPTVKTPCGCPQCRVSGPVRYTNGNYPQRQRCLTCGGIVTGERLREVQQAQIARAAERQRKQQEIEKMLREKRRAQHESCLSRRQLENRARREQEKKQAPE